jgi:site-specific DNA-methyltransferase (adenine-specific)
LLISTEQGQKPTILLKKEINNQQIILGDCLELFEDIQERTIDIFMTSPRNNLGIKYNSYNDIKSTANYLARLRSIFTQTKRGLRDDGSIFLDIGCSNNNPLIRIEVDLNYKDYSYQRLMAT